MGGTNPVAPYTKIDNTTFSFSAYKTAIDANSVAAQRIVGRFAPHAQASPNMTVMLDAGSLFDGTTLTEVAAQSTSAITAPMVHPRIDRVVIDNVTGALSVVTGSEATSPVPGAIPTGKSPVAQIALTTSTSSITNAIITDERNFSALAPGGFGALTSISSAATCDIGTILSRNVKITGTTTIASLGSSASTVSPIYLVKFAGALTLTNSSSLTLIGGADIVTAAGDTAVFEYLGSGNWNMRNYTRADGTALVAPAVTTYYLNPSYAEYKTYATITSVIPFDDTVPQSNEGSQILSTTFTPHSVTNMLRIRIVIPVSTDGAHYAMAALFNGGSSAITAAVSNPDATRSIQELVMEFAYVPGTSSPITFTVRVGCDNSSFPVYINGHSSGRVLGGSTRATIVIDEIVA